MPGILGKSFGVVRYGVEGELPENAIDFIQDKIKECAFKDIDDNFEARSIGLVSVVDLLDNKFEKLHPVVGDYVVFSIRIDERKVPAAILKKFCQKEEDRIKKERQIPKLSRGQRLEIKENITLMLMKKAAPAPASYDVAWNLANGVVYLFTCSKKPQELLEGLFQSIFGVKVVRQIPFFTAMRRLRAEQHAELEQIAPEIFI